MDSLDSAKGPSKTVRPFLPDTILPAGSSGFPATAWPCSLSPLNQAIQCSATCCICSGERPLYQSVPRKISMYPLFDCVFMVFLSYFQLSIVPAQCYDEPAGKLR